MEGEKPSNPIQVVENHFSRNASFFSLVVLGVAVLGGFMLYKQGFFTPTYPDGPGGTIYLSLQEKTEDAPLTIYTFDVAKKELTKSSILGTNITPVVRSDGLMAFASFDDTNETMQIFLSREGSEEYPQVTTDEIRYKREPMWSPGETNLLYLASDKEETPLPEDWGIYLTDITGNTQLLARGTNPVFSPDGSSILYLKNDGLYYRSLVTRVETKVWNAAEGDPVSGYENLDLSHDKKTLVWSDHDNGGLTFFDISSWNPFTINYGTSFPLAALDGEFSPHDDYYASYVYDYSEEEGFHNPELYIYDLSTLSESQFLGQKYLDLTGFDQDFVWVSDWH